MAEVRWTNGATVASMAYVSAMSFRSASAMTFLYALGYPIGALAVSALSPMAVLIFRFGLAAAILSSWALLACVSWPTGVELTHVLVSGLLAQGVLFVCLYLALQHAALVGIAVGGVYQQRFCAGVDFRVTATLQNAVCIGPVVVLASLSPLTVRNPLQAVVAGGRRRTSQRHAVHDDVCAGDQSPRRANRVDAVLCDPGGCRSVGVDDAGPAP